MEEINYEGIVTKGFLEAGLGSTIKSFTATTGSKHGDNFCSILISIEAHLENQETPVFLLLKIYPDHPIRRKLLSETNVFHKELLVYKELVPELHGILDDEQRRNIKLSIPGLVCGKAVDYTAEEGSIPALDDPGTEDSFTNYLLMVDERRTRDFRMASRLDGLDLEHCKLVMREVAKLHALSWNYTVKNELGSLQDKFPYVVDRMYGPSQEPVMRAVLGHHFGLVGAALEGSVGSESEAYKGLLRFKEDPYHFMKLYVKEGEDVNEEAVRDAYRLKPDISASQKSEPWKVGSHGDCWINNMLFRYDPTTGKPLETMLVDLQIYREVCPTLDLSYFFYTSTTRELRDKHLDGLLEIYAQSFLDFCQDLEVRPLPGFTIPELKHRFHRSKLFGLMTGIMVLPLILQEAAQDLDQVETKEEENFSKIIVSGISGNAGENKCLAGRYVGLVSELYEQGVL